jgi:cell division protein FtsQ
MAKRRILRKVLRGAGWLLTGTAVTFLLAAAVGIRGRNTCQGYRIGYVRPDGGRYVDTARVAALLTPTAASLAGRPLRELDLHRMERALERDPWIRDADLYFDRAHVLQVRIEEENPVARIFTRTGHSFYIDSHLNRIPLNPHHTPRLPVFTGMPVTIRGDEPSDTLHLRSAWAIVRYLRSDPLSLAIVEQVDFEAPVGFVIYPKVGDHRIVFGEPGEIAGKFRRLRIFYDQVLAREGWSRYRELDLRFRDQIVALPAGLVPLPTDTLAGTPLPDSTGLANPRPATGPPTPAPTPRPKAILPPTRP